MTRGDACHSTGVNAFSSLPLVFKVPKVFMVKIKANIVNFFYQFNVKTINLAIDNEKRLNCRPRGASIPQHH